MSEHERTPYAPPTASAVLVIRCEVDWLLLQIDELARKVAAGKRAIKGDERMLMRIEDRVADLSCHLRRLVNEPNKGTE